MPAEPTPQPPAAPTPTPTPTPTPVTSEDIVRFDDEDQLRQESNDARLRAERPPHHQ